MKSNIFSKLLTTYLVIILITLLVVGFFLTQLFQNYFFNARERELVTTGSQVSGIYTNFILGLQDPRITDGLVFSLRQLIDAQFFVAQREELVFASCPNFNPNGLQLDQDDLNMILRGESVAKRGFVEGTREQIVTVVVPSVIMNEVVGAVFLNAPLKGITDTMDQVRGLIVYAALSATFLAMIVGYYMSKSISHPLQLMNSAALEVAGGNFQQQVEVTSSDEVGQLAQTFNYMSSTLHHTVEALSHEKAKLENIMLSMNEGVMAIDTEGTVVLANPQAKLLLRLQQQDLITGQGISALLPLPEMAALFMDVIATSEHASGEYADYGGKILFLQVAPLRHGDKVWGAVGILQDVTEVRHLEQMRRDFVANVSHELRTPMTSIQGFVELLLDGLADDKESHDRYLNVILEETVRLNRLVSDLLDLSKLETRQVSWPLEPVQLQPLFDQVVTQLRPQFEKQNLTAGISAPDVLPAVQGNRDRIVQVLINLLGNAISFTPPGGKISLSATEENEFIKISVADNGVGIPPEEQEKIWQRFHKVDKARTRSLGGTGLGLSIVKQIVDAHGGEVGLESTPGQGATFHFTLKKA